MKKLLLTLFVSVFSLSAACAAESAQTAAGTAAVSAPAQNAPAAKRPLRVGLVLSGGGARGFAHVGVLKVLEEAGVEVSVITATSMGSMVGGAYAEGYSPDEIADIVRSVDWTKMFASKPNRKDMNWRRKEDKENGLSDAELGISARGFALPYGIITTQELDLFLAKTNEPSNKVHDLAKLPVPYAAFATDLETGRPVKLQKNISLSQAMRASMSIPGAFAPAEWNGKLLVDGGLVNNLPIDDAREMGADVIIAVNVGTPLSPKSELGSIAGVMGQMLNILTEQNVRQSLTKLRDSDILITPDLSKYSSGDFNSSGEIMKVGEEAARQIFDRLAELGVSQTEFKRWNAVRRSATRGESYHKIAEVKVEGLETVNPVHVEQDIRIRPGETVSTQQVENAARKIWQDDDFLSVPYHFEPGPDGMEVLVFEPQEKTWGYSAFRFGGRVQTNFDDDSSFSLMLQHTLGWLNSWGGELKTAVQIGKDSSFSTQFYQPLGAASPFYLNPKFSLEKQDYDVYRGDTRASSWQNRILRGTVELGYEIGRYGTVSTGFGYAEQRNKRVIGETRRETPDGGSMMAFANLNIDRLDNTNFPTSGYKFDASVTHYFRDMGGDKNHLAYGGSATGAMTFGPWTFNATLRGGHSSFESMYRLGGAFNLTGSTYGQFAGDKMLFGRLMAYRSLSPTLMKIGAPVWAGVSFESGRAYNSHDEYRPGWKTAAGVFLGADTWVGPLYLIGGRTFGGSSGIYFMWGHIH